MKETANRAFEEMRKAALERLRIRDPREIAGLAGVTFVEETASLRSYLWGVNCDFPGRTVPFSPRWRDGSI